MNKSLDKNCNTEKINDKILKELKNLGAYETKIYNEMINVRKQFNIKVSDQEMLEDLKSEKKILDAHTEKTFKPRDAAEYVLQILW